MERCEGYGSTAGVNPAARCRASRGGGFFWAVGTGVRGRPHQLSRLVGEEGELNRRVNPAARWLGAACCQSPRLGENSSRENLFPRSPRGERARTRVFRSSKPSRMKTNTQLSCRCPTLLDLPDRCTVGRWLAIERVVVDYCGEVGVADFSTIIFVSALLDV